MKETKKELVQGKYNININDIESVYIDEIEGNYALIVKMISGNEYISCISDDYTKVDRSLFDFTTYCPLKFRSVMKIE